MRQARSAIFDRIGKMLHEQFEDVAREPLPERWVDLINYLNDKERAQRDSDGAAIRRDTH
jgi:hypothetical protein